MPAADSATLPMLHLFPTVKQWLRHATSRSFNNRKKPARCRICKPVIKYEDQI